MIKRKGTLARWAFAAFALALCLGQFSFLSAGSVAIQPKYLVYTASVEPVPGGPPEFSPNSAGSFLVQIQVGLDPGTYGGVLLTSPGEPLPVCSCPTEGKATCACVINEISLNRR